MNGCTLRGLPMRSSLWRRLASSRMPSWNDAIHMSRQKCSWAESMHGPSLQRGALPSDAAVVLNTDSTDEWYVRPR